MTTVRHVARAHGSTGLAAPAYRVELRAGTHELLADEPTGSGGGDLGPTPFGLVVSTAMTLRMYAARKGFELSTIDVDVRYDVADGGGASIVRTITVPADLPADQRERLADIAERTPVTVALRGGTPITTTFRQS
jgi:putative redox protein